MEYDKYSKSFSTVNPQDYKGNVTKFMFDSQLFKQLSLCLYFGSYCGTDRESLRKFERAVKMLEAFIINSIDKEYVEKIEKIRKDGLQAGSDGKYEEYYEYIRLRFMTLMQIINAIPDIMPEEKAIEVI